jgi:hypothetical protein
MLLGAVAAPVVEDELELLLAAPAIAEPPRADAASALITSAPLRMF